MTLQRAQKVFATLCVAVLVLSTLPLYAISFYNHPYYDDYGFSASVHQAWKETGSLGAVLASVKEASVYTFHQWQGNYTSTLLSNLQPGLFSENLYWIGSWFILTSLIVCVAFFLCTAFEVLGLERWARISLSSLALMVIIQFIPDAGEAFFWFNGGVGNTFIYALIALTAALCIRLYKCSGKGLGWTALLLVMAVLLGGGSYGGGLFILCLGAVGLVWLFWKKGTKRFHFILPYLLFAACFLFSMSAPGNTVRAGFIQYKSSPLKTILQSLYYGTGLMSRYIRLPLIAVTLPLLPAICEAAGKSGFSFKYPVRTLVLAAGLYCTQFAPPLYSIASIGAGRIVNTYCISFVMLWFFGVYYLAGYTAGKIRLPEMNIRRMGTLVLVSLCLFGTGCLGFRCSGDVLYGAQNMSGPSALLSIITGEAAQYDREMDQREMLLNDESQPVVELAPLSVVPRVLMDDLIVPDAVYDTREALCLYYGKEAIHIAGEEGQK